MTIVERVSGLLGRNLGVVAGGLTYLVAVIHLFHPDRGLPRLAILSATDNLGLLATDPRPVAFVVAGTLLLLGPQAAMLNVRRRAFYLAGMAIAATFFVGYFVWHLTGHGGFIPGRPPNYHGLNPIVAVVDHLVTYPVAALSKAAEAALFAALFVLYRREGAAGASDDVADPDQSPS